MTKGLYIKVYYIRRSKSWVAEYNKRYGNVGKFDKKEEAVKKAKSEAQARANGEGEPVKVKIYKMNGNIQDTVTKRP